MTNLYQGDPKITIEPSGANMTFKNGQPVMDQGLENASLMSFFTRENWVGNIFFDDPNQKIGSNFEETANQTITITSLNDIGSAGQSALQWMLDNGTASNTVVRASNPDGKKLDVACLIEPPGRDVNVLLLNKSGLNWIAQKIDPAYLKV